ncbi:MAG: hypothetical protein ACFB0B_15315 [Thermonemataceae bacterium]
MNDKKNHNLANPSQIVVVEMIFEDANQNELGSLMLKESLSELPEKALPFFPIKLYFDWFQSQKVVQLIKDCYA